MLSDHQLLKRLEYDPQDLDPADWQVSTFLPFRMACNPKFGVGEAVPIQPIYSSVEVVAAIPVLFEEERIAGCSLTIEFNERLWPGLGPVLDAAGLTLGKRETLPACTPQTFRQRINPNVEVRFLGQDDSRDEFDRYQSVVAAGRGEGDDTLSDEDLARFREEVRPSGTCRAIIARIDGQPVGTAYSWCNLGRAYITRVHTLQFVRRQGVASTVMSELMTDSFKGCGDLVVLTASGPPAVRLYEKLGFRRVGDRLFYRQTTVAAK